MHVRCTGGRAPQRRRLVSAYQLLPVPYHETQLAAGAGVAVTELAEAVERIGLNLSHGLDPATIRGQTLDWRHARIEESNVCQARHIVADHDIGLTNDTLHHDTCFHRTYNET